MKKSLIFAVLALLVVLVTGCSAKIGGTSVKPTAENSVERIRKALTDNKTIYYKIVYCEAGFLNWSIVKEPMANPDKITMEFGEVFSKKAEEMFKERGLTLIRINEFSPTSSNVQIEMRVAAKEVYEGILFIPTGKYLLNHIGTRWFVYYRTNDKPLELYDFQIRSLLKVSTMGQMTSELISRMTTALLTE